MSFNIALQFEDGVSRTIVCKSNELVSDAAYKAKINIPLDCRDGACGTCKCHCESGSYQMDDYIEDALTQEEADNGLVLTCKMMPTSDCVVRVPASSHACKTQVESFHATLTSISRDSPTTVAFTLVTQEQLKYLPGQYVNLKVPGTDETRSYSFSSAPGGSESSFLIRDVPNGLMSQFMRHEAKVGDAIEFTGPFGTFYLRPTIRPILMLAGGTGLAPFLAMMRWIHENRTDQPILLAYGVNTTDDLVELHTLEQLKRDISEFDYITVVADPASGHPLTGYVTNHLKIGDLHDGEVDIYVCGPPAMVDGVQQWLTDHAITPKNLFFEKFT